MCLALLAITAGAGENTPPVVVPPAPITPLPPSAPSSDLDELVYDFTDDKMPSGWLVTRLGAVSDTHRVMVSDIWSDPDHPKGFPGLWITSGESSGGKPGEGAHSVELADVDWDPALAPCTVRIEARQAQDQASAILIGWREVATGTIYGFSAESGGRGGRWHTVTLATDERWTQSRELTKKEGRDRTGWPVENSSDKPRQRGFVLVVAADRLECVVDGKAMPWPGRTVGAGHPVLMHATRTGVSASANLFVSRITLAGRVGGSRTPRARPPRLVLEGLDGNGTPRLRVLAPGAEAAVVTIDGGNPDPAGAASPAEIPVQRGRIYRVQAVARGSGFAPSPVQRRTITVPGNGMGLSWSGWTGTSRTSAPDQSGSGAIPATTTCATWSLWGTIQSPETGPVVLTVTRAQAGRLWLDGRSVMDQARGGNLRCTVDLQAGTTVRIHLETVANAKQGLSPVLTWSWHGRPAEAVPLSQCQPGSVDGWRTVPGAAGGTGWLRVVTTADGKPFPVEGVDAETLAYLKDQVVEHIDDRISRTLDYHDRPRLRWSTRIVPDRDGDYQFQIQGRHPFRLWVAGRPVLERWWHARAEVPPATIALRRGVPIAVTLESQLVMKGGLIRLLWQPPGNPGMTFPHPNQCLPDPVVPIPPSSPVLAAIANGDAVVVRATTPDAGAVVRYRLEQEASAPSTGVGSGPGNPPVPAEGLPIPTDGLRLDRRVVVNAHAWRDGIASPLVGLLIDPKPVPGQGLFAFTHERDDGADAPRHQVVTRIDSSLFTGTTVLVRWRGQLRSPITGPLRIHVPHSVRVRCDYLGRTLAWQRQSEDGDPVDGQIGEIWVEAGKTFAFSLDCSRPLTVATSAPEAIDLRWSWPGQPPIPILGNSWAGGGWDIPTTPGLALSVFDEKGAVVAAPAVIHPFLDRVAPQPDPKPCRMRWRGWILPERSGDHFFNGGSDRGLRIWVAGRLVWDALPWAGSADKRGAAISLKRGEWAPIQIESEHGLAARLVLRWAQPGMDAQPLPGERLRPDADLPVELGPVALVPETRGTVRGFIPVVPIPVTGNRMVWTRDDLEPTMSSPSADGFTPLDGHAQVQARLVTADGRLGPIGSRFIMGGAPGTGLTAQYFADDHLGELAVETLDPAINFLWDARSPKQVAQVAKFSARWQGGIEFLPVSGQKVVVTSNGRTRLWLGGKQEIDAWDNATLKTFTIDVDAGYLRGRRQPIRLEYANQQDDFILQLQQQSAEREIREIPTAWLYPQLSTRTGPLKGTGLQALYIPTVGEKPQGTAITRVEGRTSPAWGEKPPQEGPFLARWQATLTNPDSEAWALTCTSDGGLRIRLGDEMLIDDWQDGPVRSRTSDCLPIRNGESRLLVVEYYHAVGRDAPPATFTLDLLRNGKDKSPIPTTWLSPVETAIADKLPRTGSWAFPWNDGGLTKTLAALPGTAPVAFPWTQPPVMDHATKPEPATVSRLWFYTGERQPARVLGALQAMVLDQAGRPGSDLRDSRALVVALDGDPERALGLIAHQLRITDAGSIAPTLIAWIEGCRRCGKRADAERLIEAGPAAPLPSLAFAHGLTASQWPAGDPLVLTWSALVRDWYAGDLSHATISVPAFVAQIGTAPDDLRQPLLVVPPRLDQWLARWRGGRLDAGLGTGPGSARLQEALQVGRTLLKILPWQAGEDSLPALRAAPEADLIKACLQLAASLGNQHPALSQIVGHLVSERGYAGSELSPQLLLWTGIHLSSQKQARAAIPVWALAQRVGARNPMTKLHHQARSSQFAAESAVFITDAVLADPALRAAFQADDLLACIAVSNRVATDPGAHPHAASQATNLATARQRVLTAYDRNDIALAEAQISLKREDKASDPTRLSAMERLFSYQRGVRRNGAAAADVLRTAAMDGLNEPAMSAVEILVRYACEQRNPRLHAEALRLTRQLEFKSQAAGATAYLSRIKTVLVTPFDIPPERPTEKAALAVETKRLPTDGEERYQRLSTIADTCERPLTVAEAKELVEADRDRR